MSEMVTQDPPGRSKLPEVSEGTRE